METNIHTTFRSGFSASLRERRMAHQAPTPEAQANALLRESEDVLLRLTTNSDVDRAAEDRVAGLTGDLQRLITIPALAARVAELTTARDNLTAAGTRRTARNTEYTNLSSGLEARVTTLGALAGAPRINQGKDEVVSHFTALTAAINNANPYHNISGIMTIRSRYIRRVADLDAGIKGHADVNMTGPAGLPARETEQKTFMDTEFNPALNEFYTLAETPMPADPGARDARIAVLRTKLDVITTKREDRFVTNVDSIKATSLAVIAGAGAPIVRAQDLPEQLQALAAQRSRINELYFRARARLHALDPATSVGAPTTGPSTGPSTPPTGTPEAAFNNLPTTIRPFARDLRDAIINGTDTAAALAGINAQLASRPAAEHEGIRALLDTYLRNTPKTVRLTGAVLSLADRTATPSGTPGSYPPAGPGVMGALPPLPAGMEQPANAFFNQARPFLGILRDIGVLPPSFAIAMNAMNGREVTTLQNEINVRNQQLAERRTRLTTLAVGSPERTQVEGEIRAIEFRIQQLTQQIATLRTATSTGSPEMQALMRQLITQFLRMQRQGGQMGMMPMLRPGGGGFDLYGTNQLGNAAMGYGYGRVGTMGGGIGYYPMGYAPVGVVGSPVVGPPMMGPPMMGPGPMPFPPRPPMMGGGMVMGGGFFTAPKPSGNDSRPV